MKKYLEWAVRSEQLSGGGDMNYEYMAMGRMLRRKRLQREQTFVQPIRISPDLANRAEQVLASAGIDALVEPSREIGSTTFIIEPIPATSQGFSDIEKALRRAGISFSR